ncbi:amidohydrolase family protein [Telmatobacter bradus]|uniref:amidohydrolase family protein n=1 Tax=Telmatobacter bradus TaxID=474953 RepID=UPI003B433CAD
MRTFSFFVALNALVLALSGVPAQPQPASGNTPTLALTGGTVVDLTAWGESARDLENATVLIRDGHITEVGPSTTIKIPKDARVLDCHGKYILPGLVDGYAGMNNQRQASANLYMGVTTVVVRNDAQHGAVSLNANPSPHLYLIDTVGSTDNWSLLGHQPQWAEKLQAGTHPSELSPEETTRQLSDTARMGTRVLFLGRNITAANTQRIIARAHQLGLITYGEFAATPYEVGINAGVDVLIRMDRYDLGDVPDELQRPLAEDPWGAAANTAYDYAGRVPPTDLRLRNYAHFVASHHAVLMPAFSLYYVNLPGHRNLWKEQAAALLDPAHLNEPSNPATGEMDYPLSPWTHRLPAPSQHWMEDNLRKKADQHATRLWQINEAIFSEFPHYLAASGASVHGTMPGISLHTELELLVRLGLTPREALASATTNYAVQFGWYELGVIAPGRRADVLVLDANPTKNIWNARRINTLLLDGNIIDREALLRQRK